MLTSERMWGSCNIYSALIDRWQVFLWELLPRLAFSLAHFQRKPTALRASEEPPNLSNRHFFSVLHLYLHISLRFGKRTEPCLKKENWIFLNKPLYLRSRKWHRRRVYLARLFKSRTGPTESPWTCETPAIPPCFWARATAVGKPGSADVTVPRNDPCWENLCSH